MQTENRIENRASAIALGAVAGLLFVLFGCAHEMNPRVTDAEVAYRSAMADPAVASKGQVQLYEANRELDRAKKAFDEGEDEDVVDHYAYLAQRRVDIARATAERAVAEQRVETLGERRDAVVLDARTREANQARARAEAAELTAESLRAEIADLQAKQTPRGLVITLNNDVLFDVDRAELKPGAMSEIHQLAQALNTDPERKVRVEGHADSTGSDAYNLDLSKRRADAVAAALISDGVDPSRVTAQGFGESMPVATNANEAGRQQNRRVEIVVQQPASVGANQLPAGR
jgi:outer membrane protein OmpA-like peptidoglycan-associated protein